MELIPAIDLLNNIVVKAFQGERKKYRPIKSKLVNSPKLDEVITSMLNEHKFKKIYIADLNAIMCDRNNFAIIKKVVKKFSNIEFWVDPGIKTFSDFKKFKNIPCKIIIGSETLKDIHELKKIYKCKQKEVILSLDFKNNSFLGPKNLINKKELWTKRVIFMLIDFVGSKKRPELKKLKKFGLKLKNNCYLAGGVASNQDINFFKKKGYEGVILSTAIHEKKIIYEKL